jgi:hypothetical protein
MNKYNSIISYNLNKLSLKNRNVFIKKTKNIIKDSELYSIDIWKTYKIMLIDHNKELKNIFDELTFNNCTVKNDLNEKPNIYYKIIH